MFYLGLIELKLIIVLLLLSMLGLMVGNRLVGTPCCKNISGYRLLKILIDNKWLPCLPTIILG